MILADAGDFSQGDVYVSVSKGEDAVAMMNAAGYDLATLGNHEFDYGYDQLKSNLSNAQFRLICADILENGRPVFDPTCLYETKDGAKIGFFGLATPETQTKTSPALTAGLVFPAAEEMYQCAQEPIQSTGTKFSHVGVIVLEGGKITDHYLIAAEGLARDEETEECAKKIEERVDAEYDVRFAESEVVFEGDSVKNRTEETNNGNLITDALLWYADRNPDLISVPRDHVIA